MSKSWSPKATENWLDSYALDGNTVGGVIRHAQNCLMKKQAQDKIIPNHEEVLEMVARDHQKYEKYRTPPIWSSGIKTEQVACIIMHLLFLGISKCMMGIIEKWLGLSKKKANFHRSMVGVLDSVKQLNLPWVKAMPYLTGTGGAWVSENYLAYARLMPWIISIVDHVVEEKYPENYLPAYNTKNKK